MQYIGTLMRAVDPEPIRRFVEEAGSNSKEQSIAFHKIEKWRDELIAGKNGVLDDVVREFPEADRQHIRQLVRNALKENEKEKTPRSSRALFKYLKEVSAES